MSQESAINQHETRFCRAATQKAQHQHQQDYSDFAQERMTMTKLPIYKCHKTVRAAKITRIGGCGDDLSTPCLFLDLGDVGVQLPVTEEFMQKHKPQDGGYYVQYEDGYTSYSPAEAFEGGYTLVGEAHSADPVEAQIQAKGLIAPRVTPEDIEANIAGEFSFTVGNAARALSCPVSESVDLLTICVLTLKNGFTVTGESACASPENFDAEIGRTIAYENAFNKIWPLMGYALKERLNG